MYDSRNVNLIIKNLIIPVNLTFLDLDFILNVTDMEILVYIYEFYYTLVLFENSFSIFCVPSFTCMMLLMLNLLAIPLYEISTSKFLMMTIILLTSFISFVDLSNIELSASLFAYNVTLDLFSINNFDFLFAGDSISLVLIFLNQMLFTIALLVSYNNLKVNSYPYLIAISWLQFVIVTCLLSMNLFFFYFFFEFSLIPMFLMIGIWGSKRRKIYASYQFLFYTMLGSIFLIFSLFYLYFESSTLNALVLDNLGYATLIQLVMWLFLFMGFSTKVPMIPFHVWLPEAHVEAPTSGSVILAGILLKLGTYGIFRFLLPLSPYGNNYFILIVYCWTILSIFYVSFIVLRQYDLKKIIAYSSVIHMSVIIIGLFASSIEGLVGSVFLMVSHGVVSAGLFSLIGIIYDRYKTRNLFYYGGLAVNMPLFSSFFLFFTLCNMGFPLTSNFIGEVAVIVSLVAENWLMVVLLCIMVNFGTVYSIWLCNRILFGSLNKKIKEYSDLSEREMCVIGVILFFVVLLGVFPNSLINLVFYDLLLYLDYSIY